MKLQLIEISATTAYDRAVTGSMQFELGGIREDSTMLEVGELSIRATFIAGRLHFQLAQQGTETKLKRLDIKKSSSHESQLDFDLPLEKTLTLRVVDITFPADDPKHLVDEYHVCWDGEQLVCRVPAREFCSRKTSG